MKTATFLSLSAITCVLALLCPTVDAQARDGQPGAQAPAKDYSNSPIVTRMMAFDKKHDGKLTKDEVTDERRHRLKSRIDGIGGKDACRGTGWREQWTGRSRRTGGCIRRRCIWRRSRSGT